MPRGWTLPCFASGPAQGQGCGAKAPLTHANGCCQPLCGSPNQPGATQGKNQLRLQPLPKSRGRDKALNREVMWVWASHPPHKPSRGGEGRSPFPMLWLGRPHRSHRHCQVMPGMGTLGTETAHGVRAAGLRWARGWHWFLMGWMVLEGMRWWWEHLPGAEPHLVSAGDGEVTQRAPGSGPGLGMPLESGMQPTCTPRGMILGERDWQSLDSSSERVVWE